MTCSLVVDYSNKARRENTIRTATVRKLVRKFPTPARCIKNRKREGKTAIANEIVNIEWFPFIALAVKVLIISSILE